MMHKYDKRELHFGTLALELYCAALYVLLSNHLFQRKQEHDGWKEPQGKDKSVWKIMFSSYHIE